MTNVTFYAHPAVSAGLFAECNDRWYSVVGRFSIRACEGKPEGINEAPVAARVLRMCQPDIDARIACLASMDA